VTASTNFPGRYLTPAKLILLARILVGVVFVINLQSACVFLVDPAGYASAFEIPGVLGDAVVRGFGVLFLMWNVPYAVTLWHPLRYRIALLMAIVMQTIGLVGESFIYLTLPASHALARASIMRFIVFDGIGLFLLAAAVWLTRNELIKRD